MRLSKKTPKTAKIDKLLSRSVHIMAKLRGPKGCPWDKNQTHKTLLPYLFSEAREFKRAVHSKDWDNMKEELGDILLQIVFHCQIAKEKGFFDITDIIYELNSKLQRRHPHVFGKKKLKTSKQVILQWKKIKLKEKEHKLKKR
ncbi:MAG: hypothetical protein JW871_00445 [Endomicrobiales bacterium]|nr:hypothetical protein [Endomicrobiales bacterium]